MHDTFALSSTSAIPRASLCVYLLLCYNDLELVFSLRVNHEFIDHIIWYINGDSFEITIRWWEQLIEWRNYGRGREESD
jgi:hypothetical protein